MEFWVTLKDGLTHLFDPAAMETFFTAVLRILNGFGKYAQAFFDMLP